MKKVIASVLLFAVIASLLSVSALAVNKSDLLTEAAKSSVYKYVKVAVENAARNVEVTDEQAEQILPIIKRGVAIVNQDKSSTVVDSNGNRVYTQDQVDGVMQCIDEICAILNFSYVLEPVKDAKHAGDIIFKVYDSNKTLVFEYDGDVVADTDVEEVAGQIAYLVAGVTLLIAGIATAVAAKKRYNKAA